MEQSVPEELRQLLDIAAIRQLKARYCNYADSGEHAEEFARLFSEDGVLDEGDDGVFQGRDEIRAMYETLWPHCSINQHLVFNPLIEVDGNTASGEWRLLQLLATRHPDGERAYWACGNYSERYLRCDGDWKFQHVQARVLFCCDYAEGWANTPQTQVFPAQVLAAFCFDH